jgi:NADPH-dependent curcumin reductase
MTNTQVKLAARPVGNPQQSDFTIEEAPMQTPNDGEVLIKTQYISLDPAMRGWMNEGKSYIAPIKIGDVFRAGTAGKVVESKNPDFAVGDYVTGGWGVQQFGISNGKDLVKVDTNVAPLTTYMSTLGMPGMTAYFGILNTGMPKAGETVVVSGASGAVGSVVGQIAKIKGCRVVGIAGDQEKCDYCVNELGLEKPSEPLVQKELTFILIT